MSFASLNLIPELLRAVEAQGYTEPTPIQAKAIPLKICVGAVENRSWRQREPKEREGKSG